MTPEQFADRLHMQHIPMSTFRELLALWQQIEDQGRPLVTALNIGFDMDLHDLSCTVTRPQDIRHYQSPVEGWCAFIQALDAVGRRQIGKRCKRQGRDPFTGNIKEEL